MEAELNIPTDTSGRDEIKRLRKIRNKLKRERQRAQKQQSTNDLSITTTSGHVAIVHQDIFEKFNNESFATNAKKRKELLVNLAELQDKQTNKNYTTSIPSKDKKVDENVVIANKLDKSQPVLLRGKHSEIIKAKPLSSFKKAIIESQKNTNLDNSFINVYYYTNNIVTEKLEQLCCNFIQEIVTLQEKYFKKDPKKASVKRKYVVGLHQTKKYMQMNRIHLLFIATDIKLQLNDPLDMLIKQLIGLANENNLHYVFVLKRRLLGRLTLKYIPITCLAVLNYDGLNEQYKTLLEEIVKCKKGFGPVDRKNRDNEKKYIDLLEKLKT